MDTTRLIWALHPSDPGAGGPSYHGSRRGVRSVSLDGSGTFEFPTDSESFVIRNTDTEVLEESTHYHCEIHKMPDLGGKVHYTGVSRGGVELSTTGPARSEGSTCL